MLSINTNLSSLIAQSSLKNSTNILNQAVERMSTGYKINHAKDNAANYSIATNMTTKISSLNVAEDNTLQGLDLLTTADENLDLINNHVQRLRNLAEQANNGTYGEQSLQAINAEANAIVDEINRIYESAEYNGLKLFSIASTAMENPITTASEIPEIASFSLARTASSSNGFINPITQRDTTGMDKLSDADPDTAITSGTYSISTASELEKLATMANKGLIQGGEFVLANDIDLSSYSNWTPIGNVSNYFVGTFDGNGYVVSNITSSGEIAGLFGYIKTTTIKNLGVENIDLEGANAGGIVAMVCGEGIDSNYYSEITNCYSTGTINIDGNLASGGSITFGGGIAGGYALAYLSVESCYSEANITVTQDKNTYIGGLCGGGFYAIANVENSFATGDVTGGTGASGLVGFQMFFNTSENTEFNGTPCYVKDSFYSGTVSGATENSGILFCGQVINSDSVSNCYYNSELNPTISGLTTSTTNNAPANAALGKTTSQMQAMMPTLYDYPSNIQETPDTEGSDGGGTDTGGADEDDSVINPSLSPNFAPEIIYLQVGGNSQIAVNIKFSLEGLDDLRNIGLSTGGATTFSLRSRVSPIGDLARCDEILKTISEKQVEFGSAQNRLESVLEEISIKYENLVSSRSTIRDADIAEESASYIQQQILQEAAATLLATANQSPAIALQLI